MLSRGKDRHIYANLGDKGDSSHRGSGKTGNCAKQFQLIRVRFSKPKDLGFNIFSVFVKLVDVLQAFFEN